MGNVAVPANHSVKLDESEKKDRYTNLARDLKEKKLWNMKLPVIPIVTCALGIVPKGVIPGLDDLEIRVRVETIKITALMRLARRLRRVLEAWGDLLSLKLQWKIIS